MINTPPLNSLLPVAEEKAIWPKPWGNWFTQVWQAIFGWSRTFYATKTHDFGSINAQVEATTTVTVSGAVAGDMVLVRPTTAVNGIIVDGTVSAANTVTIRAVNYSAGAINPAEQVYKVIVIQQ